MREKEKKKTAIRQYRTPRNPCVVWYGRCREETTTTTKTASTAAVVDKSAQQGWRLGDAYRQQVSSSSKCTDWRLMYEDAKSKAHDDGWTITTGEMLPNASSKGPPPNDPVAIVCTPPCGEDEQTKAPATTTITHSHLINFL